jgi:hypothetical protein
MRIFAAKMIRVYNTGQFKCCEKAKIWMNRFGGKTPRIERERSHFKSWLNLDFFRQGQLN